MTEALPSVNELRTDYHLRASARALEAHRLSEERLDPVEAKRKRFERMGLQPDGRQSPDANTEEQE